MKQPPFLNSCHRVQGLTRAWLVEDGKEPWGGKTKLQGTQAQGKAFEKKLVRSLLLQQLPQGTLVLYNRWIEFFDSTGHHFAQPDILLTTPDEVFCLEVKRTQTPFAFDQLVYLYQPLLQKLWPARRIILAQVCKNLRVHPGTGLCYSLNQARGIYLDPAKPIPTLHSQGELYYD